MQNWATQKHLLETRLKELEYSLHKIEHHLDEPHSKDFEDFATEVEDTEVLESLGNAGLREIGMIKAALARINNNCYGVCQKCGKIILEERLKIVPYTPLCKDCVKES